MGNRMGGPSYMAHAAGGGRPIGHALPRSDIRTWGAADARDPRAIAAPNGSAVLPAPGVDLAGQTTSPAKRTASFMQATLRS